MGSSIFSLAQISSVAIMKRSVSISHWLYAFHTNNTLEFTGSSFAVSTLENYHVLVSSEELVKELSEAPEDHLSLHAIAKDVSNCIF